jgi:hypothetical protein
MLAHEIDILWAPTIPYAHGLQSSPVEWIILQMAHKMKLANSFILFEQWINFHVLYYPLYMLIMQVFSDFGRKTRFRSFDWLRSKDTTLIVCQTLIEGCHFCLMPDFGQKIWLQLYILTLDELPNSGRCHDSNRISWLRSCITALVDENAACLTTSAVNDFTWPG